MEYLTNLWNIAEVALGLGFVIFLHELGHFVLAKWNGVKVEKFSIGFGKTLFGFTRGETEYVLAVIPLGGFVKMLGEGPDEEAAKSTDPRAYPNKPVGARMAIISAGVIMNLILGVACFSYTYMKGRDEASSRIGAVVAGSPAFQAGLQAGDEIISIDDKAVHSYNALVAKVRLSSEGQSLHIGLKRPGLESTVFADIVPKREAKADLPTIGILPSDGLTFVDPPYMAPPGLLGDGKAAAPSLKPGDKVVAAGPVGEDSFPVEDVQTLYSLMYKFRDKPMSFVVESSEKSESEETLKTAKRSTVVLPPNRFIDLGVHFQILPISLVRIGSIAEKAGFQVGDLIVKVNGKESFDPMQLPSIVYENAGKPMTFDVVRGKSVALTLTATPDDAPPWTEILTEEEPIELSGLGAYYPIETKVAEVRPDSPASRAGLKPGDVIDSLKIGAIEKDEVFSKGKTYDFKTDPRVWPRVFQVLQVRKFPSIELTRNGSKDLVKIEPGPVEGWYSPHRGEQLGILIIKGVPLDALSAIHRGFDDTVDNVSSIYRMLKSLVVRRVSHKGLGGPLMIGKEAYDRAASGFTELVYFLGFLSVNLAVINFLPIPPLDGGQMVFLIAEKVRGRPLPDSALIAGTYVGLVLVLCLMVFVLIQDVVRYFPFTS